MTTVFKKMTAVAKQMLVGEKVNVQGLETPLFVWALTAQQKSDMELLLVSQMPEGASVSDHPAMFRAACLRAMVFDGDRKPVFQDVPDAEILALPAIMLEPLFEVCMRLGGFTKADRDQIEGK